MSDFIKVTFKPAVVNYFAGSLIKALRGKGWDESEIKEIPTTRALAFLTQPDQVKLKREAEIISSNPKSAEKGEEAFILVKTVPTFFLVEQACKVLGSGKVTKIPEPVEELELQHA